MAARVAHGGHRNRRGNTAHGAQHPFNDLLQIGLAFAQVGVFHLVKLARNDFKLRSQRPFGVVQAVNNPALDTADELHVLQEHQVNVQQG